MSRADVQKIMRYIYMINDQVPTDQVAERFGELVGEEFKEIYVTEGERLIEEGRQQGRLERGREILRRQLEHRFGALSGSALQRIEACSEEDIDRWAEVVLTAPTLDEVLRG
jgi:hypothetical protein